MTYKVLSIDEDEVLFTNGHSLEYDHEQDCCEHNFADFSSLKDTTFESDTHESIIMEASDYGVIINGHLVNCYSIQNGYNTRDVDIYLYDQNRNVLEKLATTGEYEGDDY